MRGLSGAEARAWMYGAIPDLNYPEGWSMTTTMPPDTVSTQTRRPWLAAGVFLGAGFAGFFDGIVLHQILQWHHMVTSVRSPTSVANLELNTLLDGLFHVGAFGLTATGLVLLWRAARQNNLPASPLPLVGAILAGAGIFDLTEGLIDHHLLQIHHVKSGPHQTAWDLGFLAIALLLITVGTAILKRPQSDG